MSEQQQTLTIQEAIDLAMRHQAAGRIPQAESVYNQILKTHPNQHVALHMLGVISHQVGKNEIARNLITKALKIQPDHAEAHNNLGNILRDLGRPDTAILSYKTAIALKPGYAEAHSNLSNTLLDLGRIEAAVAGYRKALSINPNLFETYSNLGNALKEMGELKEAIDNYQAAIDLKPDFVIAHFNLGNALRDLGNVEDGLASYRTALRIDPNFVSTHFNLGDVLRNQGKFNEALEAFKLADTPACRAGVMECLFALGEYNKYDEFQNACIEKDKDNISAASISAFASQQLNRTNPHPFCKEPMDFIQVYEGLVGLQDKEKILCRLITELKSGKSIWEPTGKSTRNGYQSPPAINLFADPTGSLAVAHHIVQGAIKKYRNEFSSKSCLFIKDFPKKMKLQAWFVQLLKDGHQIEHIHPDGWLSGVFYLQVPQFSDPEEGCIELGLWKPNFPMPKNTYPKKLYYPKTGDIILFPSSLFHRTIAFHSDDERLCIAFDLLPA